MGQRAGCDNVVKVFGVRKLTANALEIKENAIEISTLLSDTFDEYIKPLWACILAYRLVGVNDSKKKEEEARHLVNLKIHLISKGKFSFDGKERDFEEYDFISKSDDAYIKIPNSTLELLMKKLEFLDACAEVLMMQFRLEDLKLKKTFRDVISSDVEKNEKEICSDYGPDYLRECKELLGINETPEMIFWNKVLESKGLPLFVGSKENKITEYITKELSIALPSNYKDVVFFDVQNDAFIDLLQCVKNKMGIPLSHCLKKEGLVEYHKACITTLILDNLKKFKSLLWKKTNSLPKEEKQPRLDFISNVLKFRNYAVNFDYSKIAFELDVDYKNIVYKCASDEFGVDLNQNDDNPYSEKYLYDIPEELKLLMPKELANLVYFEGYDSEFSQFVRDFKKDTVEEVETSNQDDSSVELEESSGIDSSVVTILPVEEKKNFGANANHAASRTPHNYSPSVERAKQEHGRRAQERVVQWLEDNKYLCHERYSTSQCVDKDDGVHYDIEYKRKETAEWRFLEVKHVSNDTFEISHGEIEFACLPENKKKYDLALVKDGRVYIVPAPFANETKESFVEKFNAKEIGFMVKFKMAIDIGNS